VNTVKDVTLQENKTDSRHFYYNGAVVFDNGQRLEIRVQRDGNDFGWVSSDTGFWATTDRSRFWNSKGGEVSGDDFCKKWMDGKTLIDMRVLQNQASQGAVERNKKAFERAYQGK